MKRFKQVIALVAHPDFDQGKPPPYIDHDQIDFNALRDLFAEQFDCGEPVRLRFPNDTIDQVTFHMRMVGQLPGDPAMRDFGQELLKLSNGEQSPINVRESWRELHALPNRRRAPPPTLLPFVVEGEFEAVQIWSSQAGMRLGLRSHSPETFMFGKKPMPGDHEGVLLEPVREHFRGAFGVTYKKVCGLIEMAHGELPEWARVNPFA